MKLTTFHIGREGRGKGEGNEERDVESGDPVEEGSEAESEPGSEPERYDRRTQLNEHYQEKLGFNQEDDDEEEEKEVSFCHSLYLSYFYFIINHSGGDHSRHVHQQ